MANLDVAQTGTSGKGITDNTQSALLLDRGGALVTMDFYTKAALDGRGYQLRAGTISVPLVGDVVITDTAAEFAVDSSAGHVMIPVFQNISINLGTGTLHEYATKSVATASSGGDAFTLLPMLSGGDASSLTARVDAAGGVTVTAEAATTTLRHWSYSNPRAIVTAGGGTQPALDWQPLVPPILTGNRSLYTQIAATGTGPSYFANLDVLQFTTAQLGI